MKVKLMDVLLSMGFTMTLIKMEFLTQQINVLMLLKLTINSKTRMGVLTIEVAQVPVLQTLMEMEYLTQSIGVQVNPKLTMDF